MSDGNGHPAEADKITITWDDLRTRQVEQRIGQLSAVKRNVEYAAVTDAQRESPSARFRTLWYNTIVYMTIFGLAGGLLAWGCGMLLHFKPGARLEAAELMQGAREIRRAAEAGKISDDEKAAMLDQLARDGRHNAYFMIYLDDRLTDTQKEQRTQLVAARDAWKEFISNVLVFGVCGMLIAAGLSLAEPVVSRNWPASIINGSVGATLGIIGGIIVALFVERMYHALGGSDGSIGSARQVLARVVQWSVVGLFLSIAPGVVMGNMRKLLTGAAGGVLGGAIGGLLFDLVARVAGRDLSMLIGLCAIGGLAGAASGLIEDAAKTGWLKVTHGLIAGKQFILYRNPTYIGSSPDNQIYLFKDPQVGRRHAAIHIVPGGYDIEDLPLGQATIVNGRPAIRRRLRGGDTLQIGETRFLFQEKQRS